MFNDDFLFGWLVGSKSAKKKQEKKEVEENDVITYEQIHEILLRNFNDKKKIFEKFERKEEIIKCFNNIDQEIKNLFK